VAAAQYQDLIVLRTRLVDVVELQDIRQPYRTWTIAFTTPSVGTGTRRVGGRTRVT
jgi:hypothetical protein